MSIRDLGSSFVYVGVGALRDLTPLPPHPKNLQADDVRSPKRQRELEELTEKLARFQPSKIAIEAPYRNDTWPERYKKYLANDYVLGRNEIEQVGFRLARRVGLPTLHPVDYPMWMNGWTPSEMELAKPNAK